MLKSKFYLFFIIVSTIINFAVAKDVALRNTNRTETKPAEWKNGGGKKPYPEEATVEEEIKTDRQSKKAVKEIITKPNKLEAKEAPASILDEKKKVSFPNKTFLENSKKPLFYESEQENTRGIPDTSESKTDEREEVKKESAIGANNEPLSKQHDDLSSSSESSEDKSDYLQTRRYGRFNQNPLSPLSPLSHSRLTNAALYNPTKINSGLYNSPTDLYRTKKTQKSDETYISGNGLNRNEYPYSPTYFEQMNNWPENAFNAQNRNMQYFDQLQGKPTLYKDIPRRNVADMAALANPFLRYYSRQ